MMGLLLNTLYDIFQYVITMKEHKMVVLKINNFFIERGKI